MAIEPSSCTFNKKYMLERLAKTNKVSTTAWTYISGHISIKDILCVTNNRVFLCRTNQLIDLFGSLLNQLPQELVNNTIKRCGKPAVNPSYFQQQRESPQIPFPFSRVHAAVGETRLMWKRIHWHETRSCIRSLKRTFSRKLHKCRLR